MSEIGIILAKIVVVLVCAKIGGWLAEKLRQPAVLGELIVGVVLGPSVLNTIHPIYEGGSLSDHFLGFLAQLGAIILLFEVGLESNIYRLLKNWMSSLLVAGIGVIVPLLLAYAYFTMTNHASLVGLFVGATLTATSVGITMRVLSELKKVDSEEGQIIVSASVLDDIVGLILLSVIVSIVEVGRVSLFHVGKISAWSILFLGTSLFIGIKIWPILNTMLFKLRMRRTFIISSLALAFFLAYLSDYIGLATIVGAFAAGLILETTPHKEHIKDRLKPLVAWLVPIFFVMAGAVVDTKVFTTIEYLPQIGILFLIALVGKVIAGFGVLKPSLNKATVCVGMIPRGEVGLIFATYGITHKIITPELYSILASVLMLTTMVTPPLLKWVVTRRDMSNVPAAKQLAAGSESP